MSNKIEDRARLIAEPFLEQHNCILWDVIFEKEGAMHYLKILFEPKDGVLDMDTCEKLTPPLNKLMDAEEFIKQVDILEIGSPGLSRRLRKAEHFEKCKGKTVKIMKRLDNGKTETLTGNLTGYSTEEKTVTINKETILLKKCLRITLEEQQP
ncbi:MAG: ribosome assembly cofactor RimP [Oscillospiraceae bacterium]|nr:ribosome assembly cofactor RimP [Oscillospiraceae bacterium]